MTDGAALGQTRATRDFQTAVSSSTASISPILAPAQVPASSPDPIEVFAEQCAARALLFANGVLSLHVAVDELQASAERNGLVGRIGQDRVQAIMGAAFAAVRFPSDPDNPPQESQTPTSTIAAFWYVVSLNDPDRLKAWLADHPADVETLRKILESKR
jgi:hypothetical protein